MIGNAGKSGLEGAGQLQRIQAIPNDCSMQQGSNWKRDGREGGKSHEAETNLPHRETAKRPENSNAGWKKTARFAHGEKPIINYSFSHDLSDWDFKSGFIFAEAYERLADAEMRLFDSFCCCNVSFSACIAWSSTVRNGFSVSRLRLGTHRHAGTGFSRDSPPDWEKRFPFAYFRVRDATNIRMNPALSFGIAIPSDPAWDNAEALNQFFRMKQEAPAFPRECARAIGRKSRCGLIGWLFAANANGVQRLDFSHPFSRAVTARAGPRHDSLFIPRDNLFNWDFPASIAETA